jgi:hypothetical protein
MKKFNFTDQLKNISCETISEELTASEIIEDFVQFMQKVGFSDKKIADGLQANIYILEMDNVFELVNGGKNELQ